MKNVRYCCLGFDSRKKLHSEMLWCVCGGGWVDGREWVLGWLG